METKPYGCLGFSWKNGQQALEKHHAISISNSPTTQENIPDSFCNCLAWGTPFTMEILICLLQQSKTNEDETLISDTLIDTTLIVSFGQMDDDPKKILRY